MIGRGELLEITEGHFIDLMHAVKLHEVRRMGWFWLHHGQLFGFSILWVVCAVLHDLSVQCEVFSSILFIFIQ